MEFSSRETWTVIHGLVLGTLFLLAFAGGLAGLWSLRPGLMTTEGIKERMGRLYVGAWVMAAAAWGAVITGTWIVYPWYRVKLAPVGEDAYAGCVDAILPNASCSPRDFLKSNVSGDTELWHIFGMEWKEHVSWAAPILATAAAFLSSTTDRVSSHARGFVQRSSSCSLRHSQRRWLVGRSAPS